MWIAPDIRKERWRTRLLALALVVALYAAVCIAADVDPAQYKYKSYLLQAQAWLRGETHLDRNYEYLELAVYDGAYYVSFPPVPSVPMLLYTLIWGDDVPGGMFQKLYLAIACMLILSEIERSKRMARGECIAWAVLICFASAMLPVSLIGGVWYEAQILAFLFSVCAIVAIRRGHCVWACLSYALSVGCRPFAALLGPALLAMFLQNARRGGRLADAWKRLLPGLLAGLLVAAAYGAYNYARFGDPFEFGHNYLPEFTRSEHGQLSLHYVSQNLSTFFFGLPYAVQEGALQPNVFGFSIFISCPILLCNVVWLAQDVRRRRMTAAKWTLLAMGAANVLLLLMHRTLGGFQFGLRYALELVPYSLAWYLLSGDRRMVRRWEAVLLGFGMALNFLGACTVHV